MRRLALMPFLDRLELAAVSGWASGSAHGALAALERRGLVHAVRHAAPLIASTRRWCVSAAGLEFLAEADGVPVDELLREQPVSAHWQRALLRRLDAVGVVYRLASSVAAVAGPLRFRWYRTLALDAAMRFEDGRSVGVVRWGATSDGTAFSKRMWRVLDGRASGVGGLLVIVPDGVRLRWARRLLARAFVPVRLVVERNVLVAGADDAVWFAPGGGDPLTLHAALEGVRPRRTFPSEPALLRSSPPDDSAVVPVREVPDHLLATVLKPAEKRMLDALAQWPWITPSDLGGLMGASALGVSKLVGRLEMFGLVVRVDVDGHSRLALSNRGLAMLARRDRSDVGTALKRWSAEPEDAEATFSWRNVRGRRGRQLGRHIGHTAAVHGFAAQLARQARSQGVEVVQIDPPHRSVRFFRRGRRQGSAHPDAFGVLRSGSGRVAFFLEWEMRAVRPSTMAAKLRPYLGYYATGRPVDDHGVEPVVLMVFEDAAVEARFLVVARKELAHAGVPLPLRVSHRERLEQAGRWVPFGAAWTRWSRTAPSRRTERTDREVGGGPSPSTPTTSTRCATGARSTSTCTSPTRGS